MRCSVNWKKVLTWTRQAECIAQVPVPSILTAWLCNSPSDRLPFVSTQAQCWCESSEHWLRSQGHIVRMPQSGGRRTQKGFRIYTFDQVIFSFWCLRCSDAKNSRLVWRHILRVCMTLCDVPSVMEIRTAQSKPFRLTLILHFLVTELAISSHMWECELR